MTFSDLPQQPHWVVSYYRVGRLLHGSLILFILESLLYGYMLKISIQGGNAILDHFLGILFSFLFRPYFFNYNGRMVSIPGL